VCPKYSIINFLKKIIKVIQKLFESCARKTYYFLIFFFSTLLIQLEKHLFLLHMLKKYITILCFLLWVPKKNLFIINFRPHDTGTNSPKWLFSTDKSKNKVENDHKLEHVTNPCTLFARLSVRFLKFKFNHNFLHEFEKKIKLNYGQENYRLLKNSHFCCFFF
jgi:hypothetical protein